MTKHEKDVLEKYVTDTAFNIQDCQDSLGMNSRNGTINKMKNLGVEALRGLGKTSLQTLLNKVE